jgi:polyisoprenoid-binding protein YceI
MKEVQMKKLVLAFMFIFTLTCSIFAQSIDWEIDKAHTNVGFTITHLVISDVTGRFKEFEGSIKSSGEDFDGAEVNIVINTASIFTDNEKRDNHLRSGDFFSAEKNPQITFKSSSFKKVSDDKYTITGELTMNGISREVVLDGTLKGIIKDPWGGTRSGFKANTTIDRYDYNLKYNQALEAGGFLIGKEVDIEINIELKKKG